MRKLILAFVAMAMLVVTAAPAAAGGPPPRDPDGDRVRVIVYVSSQGKYYDSIVGPSLPANGPFQQLYEGPMGLTTEFGPGDPGYLGGRWWVDDNGDGEMNEGDRFFSCPLLGKGSAHPPT
jgi:hypothetical protein